MTAAIDEPMVSRLALSRISGICFGLAFVYTVCGKTLLGFWVINALFLRRFVLFGTKIAPSYQLF